MSARKQNILIVGGGAAGVVVATTLSKSLDPARFSIQLVTERTFNVHMPAMTRLMITSSQQLETKALNPYDRIFPAGKAGEVVLGSVTKLDDGIAHLADGTQLGYDWLVLATGTVWPGPLMFPNGGKKEEWVDEWRGKIGKAKDVVIIGGGAVGVEYAGEIKHFFPDKHVTIVHSQDNLLNSRYPVKFRSAVVDKITKAGVRVILNDRASMPAEPSYSSVTTEKGVQIKADLVLPLWGGSPNTAFLKASFDPTILTPKNFVRVLPTLQVPLANGKRNVYALGDIIDWPEEKMLAKVPSQAAVVAANVLAQTQGKPVGKEYKGFMEGILLPVGPNAGIGYLPLLWGITMGDWAARSLKSKTLFVENAQKMMGYA